MTTTPAAPGPHLPDHVLVIREANKRDFAVVIDGEPVPYLLAEGVTVEVTVGQPGTVTLTLLAKHIEVQDKMLVNLEHDHGGDSGS